MRVIIIIITQKLYRFLATHLERNRTTILYTVKNQDYNIFINYQSHLLIN